MANFKYAEKILLLKANRISTPNCLMLNSAEKAFSLEAYLNSANHELETCKSLEVNLATSMKKDAQLGNFP